MTTKIVQVGLGVRGAQWVKVIERTPDCEIVSFVARNVDRLKRRADELGLGSVPCYNDLAQALDRHEADILLLVSPPEVHREQALLGFEHGLHLLAEKPLTEDLAEAIEIVAEAEKRNLSIGISMNFRYLAPSQEIRRVVQDGDLGTPAFSQYTYIRNRNGNRTDLNSYCMEMKQPMLLEQSVHHLDLLRYCLASDPVWVQADTWNPPWSTYNDDSNVSVLMELKNGAHVNYMGTWTSGSNRLRFLWQTDFPGGTLAQNRQFQNLSMSRFEPELALTGTNYKQEDDTEPLKPLDLPVVSAFTDDSCELLERFLTSIKQGTRFETDGIDHLKTLSIVHAAVESAESGQRIVMADFYKEQGIPEEWTD